MNLLYGSCTFCLTLTLSDTTGVEAAPAPVNSDDHYDQTSQTIRVFFNQLQAIRHEEHGQFQKAVSEAQEEAEMLRKELTAARAELQSLKNLLSSVVQKLSQGTTDD